MDERYGACLGTTNRSFVAIMIADGFSVRMERDGQGSAGLLDALGETMGDIYVSDMRMTIIDNPTANNRSFVPHLCPLGSNS